MDYAFNIFLICLAGVNEVYRADFEIGDRFSLIQENGNRDNLDWSVSKSNEKPMRGPIKDASKDSRKGQWYMILISVPNSLMRF